MLRSDVCAADPPRRHRKRVSDTDLIDALDTIGVPYHHGGPYDSTFISRNLNEKFSPVAAVHDSNMEAIRATPRENIQDSLQRHVPLQGTASVAPGERDLSGQFMNYAEGADLMRETDAAGGAYKRWPDIPYHPDDLKGKGEPSYTIERNWKAKSLRHSILQDGAIEMQSQRNNRSGPTVRQRSFSNAAEASSTATAYRVGNDDLKRSHTTSKGLRGSLMRRLGSLRKAGPAAAE